MADQNPNMEALVNENQFLRAAAHGMYEKLKYSESLLQMAMDFMISIDYETAIDAAQCVAIATNIKLFLEQKGDDDSDE